MEGRFRVPRESVTRWTAEVIDEDESAAKGAAFPRVLFRRFEGTAAAAPPGSSSSFAETTASMSSLIASSSAMLTPIAESSCRTVRKSFERISKSCCSFRICSSRFCFAALRKRFKMSKDSCFCECSRDFFLERRTDMRESISERVNAESAKVEPKHKATQDMEETWLGSKLPKARSLRSLDRRRFVPTLSHLSPKGSLRPPPKPSATFPSRH